MGSLAVAVSSVVRTALILQGHGEGGGLSVEAKVIPSGHVIVNRSVVS